LLTLLTISIIIIVETINYGDSMVKKGPRHLPDTNPSLEDGINFLEKESRVKFRVVENSTGFMLGNAAARVKLEMLRTFKVRGYTITPEQWIVLNTVAEHEGICQRDLADLTQKDRPTITRILDILEAGDLISRRAGTDDRRMFNVHLTDEGKKSIETFSMIADDVDRKAFGNISESELERFKQTLAKIMENIET
jgi:MarR family transcriptional regulator, transcriptional regulator for hemolysin